MARSSLKVLYLILVVVSSSVHALLSPACECISFNGTEDNLMGHFTSPDYPLPYREEISCMLYVFTVPYYDNRIVEIEFRTFDVGDPSYGSCNNRGYLSLFLDKTKPYVTASDFYDVKLCGNITTLSQTKFYSSSKVLIMEFHSDHKPPYHSHRGFEGFYRYIDAGMYTSDGDRKAGSACTYYIMSHFKKEGQFFSPKYPQNYRNNEECSWIFTGSHEGERVQITFLRIDLAVQTSEDKPIYETRDGLIFEYNHPNRTCAYGNAFNDLLTVHDGGSENDPIIKRFCGKHRHQEILSTGKDLFVTFRTNEQITMQGFAALYKFIIVPPKNLTNGTVVPQPTSTGSPPELADQNESKASGSSCVYNYTSSETQSGVIISQNYPDKYPDGTICRYTFYAKPNSPERVRIEFNEFNLGYSSNDGSCAFKDTLTAYVKINNTIKTVLKKFCGSKLPPAIMGNGEYLELEFESKQSSTAALNYNISFRFVSDFGIKSDEIASYKDSTNGTALPEAAKPAACIHFYKSSYNLTGEFTSPNYPGLYPHQTECTYVFNGEGKRVKIDFLYFDVNGVPPGCRDDTYSDYVSFSIFYYTDDKLLQRYCTQSAAVSHKIITEPLFSDSDYFSVRFRSDAKNEGTGFRARYTFLEPPSEINTAEQPGGQQGEQTGENNSTSVTSSMYLLSLTLLLLIFTQQPSLYFQNLR